MNGWLWNHNDYIVLKVSLSVAATARRTAVWERKALWTVEYKTAKAAAVWFFCSFPFLFVVSVGTFIVGAGRSPAERPTTTILINYVLIIHKLSFDSLSRGEGVETKKQQRCCCGYCSSHRHRLL